MKRFDIDNTDTQGQLYTCPECGATATILYGPGVCGACHHDVADDHPSAAEQQAALDQLARERKHEHEHERAQSDTTDDGLLARLLGD